MALPGVLLLEERAVGSAQQWHTTASQDARGADPHDLQQEHACARVFSHPDLPLWQLAKASEMQSLEDGLRPWEPEVGDGT
jgi:hypothetical protein